MSEQQKQTSWFISLGFIKIPPESMYQEFKQETKVASFKPSKRSGYQKTDPFDWSPIKRGLRKMEKAIYVLVRRGDIRNAQEAYHILLERDFLAPNIYDRIMSLNRFRFYYHKIRKDMGADHGRVYCINFIKKHYLTMSPEDLAIMLDLTPAYVGLTISKINRGLIK